MGNINLDLNFGHCVFCCGLLVVDNRIEYDIDDLKAKGFDFEDVLWSEKFKCIGLNNSPLTGSTKAFISGNALLNRSGVPGSMHVERGDDPDFPFDTETNKIGPNKWVFGIPKSHNHGVNNVFPFHTICLQIFEQVLYREFGVPHGNLDKEKLYETLLRLTPYSQEQYPLCVDYLIPESGAEEMLILNPADRASVELEMYIENMPQRQVDAEGSFLRIARNADTLDPFKVLPSELTLRLFGYLSLSDIISFRLASRTAASTPLTNSVWREIVFYEMPWVCDIFPSPNREVDFKEVYKGMKLVDFTHWHSNPPFARRLVNRKRVWDTCFQIAHAYDSCRILAEQSNERMDKSTDL